MFPVDIQNLITLSEKAAEQIRKIYQQPSFAISQKLDKSWLTQADITSHKMICAELKKLYPAIPVISEEATEFHDYQYRKNWEYFFLVDPLDGTKEFIERNGEFTINIALVRHGQPVLGVINAPALQVIYYAEQNKGAYKIQNNHITHLTAHDAIQKDIIRVAISRSHACEKTAAYLQELAHHGKQVTVITAGSALKFGLVAEGLADIYPRFSPTMEWDTAAGQILIQEVGKKLLETDHHQTLQYNKLNLKNPEFIVK